MERRAARMRLSLPQRLAEALGEARTLSDGFIASYDRQGSRQAPSSSPPRPADSVYDVYSRRIALMVRNLEDEVDHAKLGSVYYKQSRDERIRRLLSKDYEGMSAEEVSFIDPSLGSVLSIRKERHAAGRDSFGRVRD